MPVNEYDESDQTKQYNWERLMIELKEQREILKRIEKDIKRVRAIVVEKSNSHPGWMQGGG